MRYTRGKMRIPGRLILLSLLANAGLFGQAPVTDARYAHLARGVNLTRWFQYGGRIPITAVDRDLLLKSGFTSVRIPVAPQYLLFNWSSPDRVARNLTALDAGIDMFLNAGMAVMLDFHADAEYLDHYLTTPGAPESLINTWRMLAARYANRNPDLLFFEIMNEPDNRFSRKEWDEEQQRILAAIREVAPGHTVVLSSVNWSGLDALLETTPYADPNVIYTLHYYSPAIFTHQGAGWTGSPGVPDLRNVPWPPFLPELAALIEREADPGVRSLLEQYRHEDWDASRVDWDIQLAAEWAKHWHVKVVVNEFGDFKPFSPPESRTRWLHDMRLALDRQKLGWAVWDYAAGFDLTLLHDGVRTIDPGVGAALGLGLLQPWTSPDPIRAGTLPALSSLRTVQIGAQPDTSGFAEGIIAADVNGDPLPDLVITPITWPSLPEHAVQVFLNSGGGILQPARFDGPVPTQRSVLSIVAGSFDPSGRPGFFLPDIGPTDGTGAQSKLILPSVSGLLTDATSHLPQQIVSTTGAAAGDVDGDGIDDLVVFHPRAAGEDMQLFRNDGSGHFAVDATAFHPEENDHFVCGAFVRRRDQPVSDLLVFGRGGLPGRVFRNDGKGHFRSGALLPAPAANGGPATGGCTAVADLNGDGNPDLIVGYTHTAASEPDVVQILINNGDGTFRDETDVRMGALAASLGGLRRIALAPTNKGKSRVLVLTRVGEPPVIKVERGDGKFADSEWNVGSGPWVVAPGDFNQDGFLDLVYGQGGGAPVVARFGQGPL
jgi:endoglucanase